MTIKEFTENQFTSLLNGSFNALCAVDNDSRIIWISDNFTRTLGYVLGDLQGKPFKSIIDVINETATGIRCRMVPKPGFIAFPVDSSQKEGIHALIKRGQKHDDFSVFSIELLPFSVESIHQFYEKDLFAILDERLNLEDFGRRFHRKLMSIFGEKRFRGTNLSECLVQEDFKEWGRVRREFLAHVSDLEAKNNAPWGLKVDSQKDGFEQFFHTQDPSWEIQKNSVRLVRQGKTGDTNYLVCPDSFDFFQTDYKIEYSFSEGFGGVFLCGIDNPVLSPDENGYLINFNNNRAILKRNANILYGKELEERPREVAIVKTGPIITIAVNGRDVLRHIDDIPFYSDHAPLNRFGLCAPGKVTYLSFTMRTRSSVFNYDALKGFRKLVRFRNDEGNQYELQIVPGLYINVMKKFLLMRELGEVARAEERMAVYKKDRDRALIRLANTERGFHGLIGNSPAIENIISTIKTVASSGASVLITGETGTGKDLVAKAIHLESGRKGPFVKIDCASLPPTLIESELFGYEKGAFTGADRRQIGKFELAHRGTVFLDEIGNLTVDIQTKLLRFLQDRQLERIGGKTTLKVDVRIVSATNTDLEEAVAQGTFRADLYYRIKVVHIPVLPLRERLMDIYPIVNHLIVSLAKQNDTLIPTINNNVFPALMNYAWPGNVRELKNAIENALIINRQGILTAEHFPSFLAKTAGMAIGGTPVVRTRAMTAGGAGAGAVRAVAGSYRDSETFRRVYDELYGKPHKIALHFGCSYNTVKRYISSFGLQDSLQSRVEKALKQLQRTEFTINDFMRRMKISKATGWKYLDVLLNQGKILKQAKGRAVFFQVLEKTNQ
ncbi:MAG: hypothetical protein A2268_09140 [Candidatus Raymondbacteria bacterium RifOxyA12_full_50_37]|nr:MAG: hypothetical protein A2268_09140 [Candidatus Raymondbacteria bacterium RifOxyA12_full_50_37]OGJ93092.1 MAG: hypothetical protein A2248_13490 [Candidatus Raymondbacteria bacterium RIFOXYA2_FULL_49_16]OGJ99244.1 MAG: hypothetical protein A2453_05000 [Candidatus Raymondbacteria bacterium RIFOXYC2_FULL_50_21]OGK06706.1 MAG: hypothetical protein A2487_03760 [Candidatus Raymondbacteria bacterium RifOxyC12_full_50_8]OGP45000.1 MAG: hypothetical protein A2324_06365 [Candidatus Raymondbacteria b